MCYSKPVFELLFILEATYFQLPLLKLLVRMLLAFQNSVKINIVILFKYMSR